MHLKCLISNSFRPFSHFCFFSCAPRVLLPSSGTLRKFGSVRRASDRSTFDNLRCKSPTRYNSSQKKRCRRQSSARSPQERRQKVGSTAPITTGRAFHTSAQALLLVVACKANESRTRPPAAIRSPWRRGVASPLAPALPLTGRHQYRYVTL